MHVELPSGPQVHVGLEGVATDRVSSALRHLLKPNGQPARGIASISQRTLVTDEASVKAVVAESGGRSDLTITVSKPEIGIAAVKAATALALKSRAVLLPALCEDPYAVQVAAAELGDAGAESILLSTRCSGDELREMVELACEVDLVGVPMRSRLGLCTRPGAESLEQIAFAHEELELLHFYSCLAGKHAPRPSEVLQSLGAKPVDVNFGSLYLAEHVPDAA